jgi:hypothetical protein
MMKLRNFLLITLLAAAGCEKSSNIGPMQDETASLANAYRSRFEELTKRYQQIDKAKRSDIEGNKEIKSLWTTTAKRLGELRNAAQQAQNSIAATTKSPNGSTELIRLQADLRERLSRGETEVVANLQAVESWLSMRAYAPKVVAVTDNPADSARIGDEMPKTGVHGDKEPPNPAKDEAIKNAREAGIIGNVPDAKVDGTAPKAEAKADAKTDAKKDAPKTDAPKKDAPKKDVPKTN